MSTGHMDTGSLQEMQAAGRKPQTEPTATDIYMK